MRIHMDITQGTLIFLLGLVLLTTGLMLPDTVASTEGECVEPGSNPGNCKVGGYEEVTREEDNDFRAPIIVGGGILVIVGIVVDLQ
ncbi:hypothetical protein [Halorientalis halophila]|uniref:hypothetical protein n=1 Tax=Halorientalis halophila TaxID=3108499 RepID=UPI003008D969